MRCEACNDPVIVRWEKMGELVVSQKPTFVMSGCLGCVLGLAVVKKKHPSNWE